MKRTTIIATITAVAMAASAPAFARPGGGGGGGQGLGAGAGGVGTQGISTTGSTMRDMGRINSMGPAQANERAIERANMNSVLGSSTTDTVTTANEPSENAANRRVNSQGAANANINALVNASPNSALGAAGVTTLTGLATGLAVNTTAGTSIGTVSEVFTNRAGAVVGIRVDLDGGGSVILPATSLSIDGSIVTTSSTQF